MFSIVTTRLGFNTICEREKKGHNGASLDVLIRHSFEAILSTTMHMKISRGPVVKLLTPR
jgi:hypothetical protein